MEPLCWCRFPGIRWESGPTAAARKGNLDGGSSQTLRSKKIEVVNQEGIVVVRITADEQGAGRLTVFDAMGEEITVVP